MVFLLNSARSVTQIDCATEFSHAESPTDFCCSDSQRLDPRLLDDRGQALALGAHVGRKGFAGELARLDSKRLQPLIDLGILADGRQLGDELSDDCLVETSLTD